MDGFTTPPKSKTLSPLMLLQKQRGGKIKTSEKLMHRVIASRTHVAMLLLSVLSLAGCQSPREIDEPEAQDKIQFHPFVSDQLRGTEETISTLAQSGFSVRAYGQGQLYFEERVTAADPATGTGIWNTANPHLWPPYELDFIGYNGLGEYGTLSADDTGVSLVLSTPEAVEKQPDIIVARTTGRAAEHATNGVPLYFKHLLSQLSVQAKNSNKSYKVEVAGVKIARIQSQATLTLPAEIKQDVELTGYTYLPGSKSFGAATASVLTLGDTPQEIGNSAVGNFMLIPQELTAWNREEQIGGAADNKGTYLGVLLRITTPSGAQCYPLERGKYAYATIPFSIPGGMKAGVHYQVTLDFSKGAGYQEPVLGDGVPANLPADVEVSDQPWGGKEKPGKAILGGPIKFAVSVEPWVEKSSDLSAGGIELKPVTMQYGSRKLVFSIPKEATELRESDIPKVEMPGRKFIRWEDGKGQPVTFPHTLTNDFVLTAKLEPYHATLVVPSGFQFKSDRTTGNKRLELTEEGYLPEFPELEPKNANGKGGFVGWTKDAYPTIESEVVAKETVLEGDVELYAILTKGVVSRTTGSELFFVSGTGGSKPKYFTFASGVSTRSALRAAPEGIEIQNIYVAKHPVTQSEYRKVMGSNPSYFTSPDQSRFNGNGLKGVTRSDADQRPVESVTWMDAVRFCNKLSQEDGLTPVYTIDGDTPGQVKRNPDANGYRLPTEAEWIWISTAASGKNNENFALRAGALFIVIGNYAWYRDNAMLNMVWEAFVNPEYGTKPVGGKKPNEEGIYDMSGNVWEWVEDWYGDRTYERDNGPTTGTYKVLKGGSFHSDKKFLNVDYRKKHLPDRTNKLIGFRVVRNVTSSN